MRNRSPLLRRLIMATVVISVTWTLSGCSDSRVGVAPLGEGCGPERGCVEGLVCWEGTCQEPEAIDRRETTDPDGGPQDDGPGGDPRADGASLSDGGGVVDGGGAGEDGSGGADGSAGCGACDQPPSDCHAQRGTCIAGECVYQPVPGASCDDENACTVADSCDANGACRGQPKVCNTPPAAVCVSGSELLTHDATGSCSGGRCVYPKKSIDCGAGGCISGACQSDPCASVSCDTPPSKCFGGPGSCSEGRCSYPFADGTPCDDNNTCTTADACNAGVCLGAPKACTTPPADSCHDASTAKIHQKVGTCSAGVCSYPARFVNCASGCSNGRCNASGWVPMTSNTTVELYAVWGSGPHSVWAVGKSGTTLFYDGLKWQARPSGITATLYDVHGSAADNVFAITQHGQVIKFDGQSWAPFAALSLYDDACLFVTGQDEIWVGGVLNNSSGFSLFHVDASGSETIVSTGTYGVSGKAACSIGYSTAAGVWAGATKMIHHTPQTGDTEVLASYAHALYAAPDAVVFWGGWSTVTRWEAGNQTVGNPGIGGTIFGLDGTSSTRVFGAGYPGGGGDGGAVIYWDGVGWTTEAIPADTPLLHDVWAAASGEVFAVGSGGAIIRGP